MEYGRLTALIIALKMIKKTVAACTQNRYMRLNSTSDRDFIWEKFCSHFITGCRQIAAGYILTLAALARRIWLSDANDGRTGRAVDISLCSHIGRCFNKL